MTSYIEHFAKAARYSGYAVMSTSGQGGVPPAMQALSAARSKLTVLTQSADWSAIEERVEALGEVGVSVIGFQRASLAAKEPGFHVLVLRQTKEVDLALEQSFVGSFGMWLESLSPFLAKFQLSPDAVTTATGLLEVAGVADPLVSAGLKAVLQFGQSSGLMKALAVLPASNLQPSFVERWKSTDLVSEPLLKPWIIEWLWNVDTDEVHEPGHSATERSDRTLFGGSAGLQNALRTAR